MMNASHIKLYITPCILLICIALLPACGARKSASLQHPQVIGPIEDIQQFPQNLKIYADEAGPNTVLVSPDMQAELNAKFNSIYFGPWHMKKTSISRRDVSPLFKNARGYKNATEVWSQYEWDEMAANAALASFPSRAQAGITLRNTDLRELPTHERRFSEPTPDIKKNPFDNFQYSLLPVGMPLIVAHATLDGAWYYVECPIAGGWVDARDVAFVDDEFKQMWKAGPFAALIKDKVVLPGIGRGGLDSFGSIGVVLPMGRNAAPGKMNVLVPLRGPNGYARSAEVAIPADAAVKKPMPLTPANVAQVGNVMMNQPYGWGGTLGDRDCSALTRDVMTPFGIWLPRNSAAQARRGAVIPLDGLSMREKEELIMRDGVPFVTLIGMKGHIMLYVGKWKGRPAIFHNVWGVRIVQDGDDNGRHVIGKAVVTSVTPGMELKNLYRPTTFVDRLNTLTNIVERRN